MVDEMQSYATQDEVVGIAITLEELGRDFYEALGGAAREPKVLQLCHRLATDEIAHRNAFRRLQDDLAELGKSVLMSSEQAACTRQRIEQQVLPTADIIRRVACGGDVIEALTMAVKMEAEAIRFYTHLAENLPPENPVTTIIAEERNHLRLLSALRCGVETDNRLQS